LESQQWASEIDLPNVTCPWTTAPASADLRIVGFDLQHRPVIYSSMLMVIILLLLSATAFPPPCNLSRFSSAQHGNAKPGSDAAQHHLHHGQGCGVHKRRVPLKLHMGQ
jgi:hypothetical protein